MSIDLNWEAATSGPDGEELAERIRSFIHDKFQQVPLPRFIRSVQVHSFEFGDIAPELEIKDLCDPFPDFYEEDDDDGSTTTSDTSSSDAANRRSMTSHAGTSTEGFDGYTGPSEFTARSSTLDLRHQASLRSPIGLGDHLNSQFRSGSPSILPGGTSNLGYHLMLGNLSGAQTPLAAVASGSPFHPGWPDAMGDTRSMADSTAYGGGRGGAGVRRNSEIEVDNHSPSRPSTANTNPTHFSQGPSIEGNSSTVTSNDPTVIYNDHASSSTAHTTTHATRDDHPPSIMDEPHEPPQHIRERRPEDFQVICRVKYAGDVKLSLTAEILLDYPMPSFAGLPLKLNITGVTFDGIAVVAYIRRRAHLCFLSPEDADAFDEEEQPRPAASDDGESQIPTRRRFGSLLQQIRVDSEIGRNESGKQVLKNVGKVERFVLDQVRRIFEDEFVFPSFWTFLV